MSVLVRLRRTADADGRPAGGERVLPVEPSWTVALVEDVMRVLRPLTPTRTEQPGVFGYRDEWGTGLAAVEGLDDRELVRVGELVQMTEIAAAVGPEALRVQEPLLPAVTLHSRNPFAFFGLAVACLGLAIFGFTRATGQAGAVILGVSIVLVALAIALIVYGAIRYRWWSRARRYVRERGDTMPPDLRDLV